MKNNITKRFGATITAAAVMLGAGVALATTASAHVSVQTYGATPTAGGYGHVFLRVPHAAPGMSTVKFDVQIPEGVTAVKPEQVAGWTEAVEYAADGKTAVKVSWSGGNLPDTSFADFGISVKFPATPGATLYFKAVQTLSDGSTVAWIEIPAEGQDSHSLAKPAASVKLAAGGHGSNPTTGGHGNAADAAKATWNGDVIAKLTKSRATVIADVSAIRAGEKASVKLIKHGKEVTLFTATLDSRGDITKSIPVKRTGKNAYTLVKGDTVALFVNGTKLAESKIG